MNETHDFYEKLAWSEAQGHEPFWDAVYRKAFPDMVNSMLCSGDTAAQRKGVDRLVYLSNDKILRIDEKKRMEVWPDILLEYVSVDKTGALGWMNKTLVIDYLAYAFIPSKKCYLFDWQLLRRAWLNYGAEWKRKGEAREDKFRIVEAKNTNYSTWSVAVPIFVVMKAVATASIIDVSSELKGWQP